MKTIEEFGSVIELVRHFDTEAKCAEYLAKKRWGGKPVCVKCGHDTVYTLKGKVQRYKCARCREQFSVRAGTIFAGSPLKLQKWFLAVYLVTAHKKGISSAQLARDLHVTQKTAWFMLHRIRYAMGQEPTEQLKGGVEMDETYVGGKNKNRHANKKKKKRGLAAMEPVFGMVERGGKVIAMHVKSVEYATILPIIEKVVKPGCTVFTDEHAVYVPLKKSYGHEVVVHHTGEYVRGMAHTNTIEGFWASLKRSIVGIYHCVSPKHLQYYVNETAYRYNTRDLHDSTRFGAMLENVAGRLKYKTLTHGQAA